MSSSNTNDAEKADEEEFKRLKAYIQKCPEVPLQSRAVQVALASLDLELSRMERDAKLKRKFTASTSASANGSTSTTSSATIKIENEQLPGHSAGTNSTTTQQYTDNDDELMAEWQDVAQEPKSILGARLAQLAVSAMAQHQVAVKTPLAALALALHAALGTPILGFACTGVPENPASSKGFAPPIRELPKGQFMPHKWDEQQSADQIRLRYRKTAVGSVILTVALGKDQQKQVVVVSVKPANSTEPPSHELVFNLDDHVNLESFQRVLQKDGSVLPALHYKDLPTLLTNFANSIDMGPIRDSSDAVPDQLPYMDATAIPPQTFNDPLRIPPSTLPDNNQRSTNNPYDIPRNSPYDTPTIDVFGIPRPQRGDFAGDLHPPGIGDFMGNGGGNLMGPNHPMFGRGGGIGPAGGGYGMRPRFDPFGPPGGPQDPINPDLPQPPTRRPPPGGVGDPNPDHLRPPNNLNNNMFM